MASQWHLSVLGDDVPSGFMNEQAVILTPPAPIPATDLLPASLEPAWKDGETTGHLIHAALSASKGAGKPLPLGHRQTGAGRRFQDWIVGEGFRFVPLAL